MKLIEIRTSIDEQGSVVLPKEPLGAAGLKPGDELCITLVLGQEEIKVMYPQLIATPQGIGIAVQLSGRQEDNGEGDLTLPNDWLEAAQILEDSDLEVLCTPGAIVITGADILDNLPGELRELFDELGIDPGTVREVMRKEGYFV